MNLKEALLYCGSTDQLKQVCAEAGITSDDVQVQTEQAASYLLRPQTMKNRLRIFHEEDITFMRNVMNHGALIPVPANYDSADRIRNALYGFVSNTMALEIPEDAALVFHTIDTKEFNQEREKYSWIYDCMRLVPYLYGIMKLEDFCALCRKKVHFDLTDEEIQEAVQSLLEENVCPIHEKDTLLIRNGLEESGMLERLQEIHDGVSPHLLSYSAMKDLLVNRYPSKESAWQRLDRYLMHQYKNPEKVNYLLETIWTSLASSAVYSQVNEALRKDMEIDAEDEEWKALLVDCWSHTSMMLTNGYKPVEAGLSPIEIFLH